MSPSGLFRGAIIITVFTTKSPPSPPTPRVTMSTALLRNTLSIEGNIGCGKSTLLRLMGPVIQKLMDAERSGCQVHVEYEPVEAWKNVGDHGINILEAFYKDPEATVYEFQTVAFMSRIKLYASLLQRMGLFDMALIERSVFGDHTMAENCHATGIMTDFQYVCYDSAFQGILDIFPHRPLGHIYLDTPPDFCIKRIQTRDRPEESCMTTTLGGSPDDVKESYKYIYDIDAAHRANFATQSGKSRRFELPVLTLDGSLPFHTDAAVQMKFAKEIVAFYEKCLYKP